jgi:hypothetical protein
MHMTMRTLAASLLLMAAAGLADTAAAQGRVKAGTLECAIAPGVGFIVGSQREVHCTFVGPDGAPRESYVGAITRFGIDIGVTAGGRMAWAVYAPSAPGRWALAGDYAGASAEATIGAGLGANVLVGGSNRTIALQPVSVQAQAGLDIAVGVAELTLRPAR